jgi:hypothetical protein
MYDKWLRKKVKNSDTFSFFSFITVSVEMEIVLQVIKSKLIIRQKACILKTKYNPVNTFNMLGTSTWTESKKQIWHNI